ncbi:glycosyltransferase [Dyadobacter sp. CY312]|uniref:glycosyltransferase n=1 Tax=Dyadobacter sp. CY312 TaxID=2907303 RepID=UPI001F1E1D50|nr:glycosyltransferase [Dyadobacter sp. CY312]MCE7042619.1 glycosyltransferase [Dyadobacter sp. CY312]
MQEYILPVLISILWILAGSYFIFTVSLKYLWNKLPQKFLSNSKDNFITVIVPVRNEQDNIANLLLDLNQQSMSPAQFEVLIMDDGSTDRTAELVQKCIQDFSISIQLIALPEEKTTSPKKRAIETALAIAKGNLIVATDGDCRVGSEWLQSIADCYAETGAKLISGPVTFTEENNLTDHLQTVEFASLIGSGASAISAGFPSLCNGANMAYEKQTFYEVGGYDGVRHIASGDDEFLMHKIAAKYPSSIHFLKDSRAVVRTSPHKNWTLFFRQRKRWASKWKHYQSKTPLVLALYVFLCNFALIAAAGLFLTSYISANTFVFLTALKVVPEWLFLGSVLRFLNKGKSILYIPVTQLIYPFYVCFFGLAAQKPEYEWKGRKLV